ncbi:DUF4145 domain-containing protein [Chloroflexota bacterium]
MPSLLCTGCKRSMEIEMPHSGREPTTCDPIRLIGSAICRHCGTGTGFEIEANTIIYVSGKSSYGSMNTLLPEIVKTLYAEAELCSQSGAPNASMAMCRASLEAALTQANFKGANLYDQIASAKTAGALDDVEVGLAHASRLITRDAIHRGELISLSNVPSILSATVRILNKLAVLTA